MLYVIEELKTVDHSYKENILGIYHKVGCVQNDFYYQIVGKH